MERRLYEAAVSGDVPSLNTLIEEDELILDRLSLTCLSETPLHLSVLRGHLEFTRALLRRKPTLATESDSLGHTPLHLASAEGHAHIVSELLRVNSDDVCNSRDQEGGIPLHLAAMRGRVKVIQELIQAWPESVYEKLGPRGDSVLHLCVTYAHLNALDFFLKSVKDKEFVKSTDNDGNTILHRAVALKQMETLKYIIISTGVVKKLASTKNANGFTALDVLEQCPRDLNGVQIRELLFQVDVHRGQELENYSDSKKAKPSNTTTVKARAASSTNRNCITKAGKILSMIWNVYVKTDDKWIEEARGSLITTAALTATVAFQAGTNPPGGVWQDNKRDPKNSTNIIYEAGTSVIATKFGSQYCETFLYYNTMSLFASMSIIILMISGVPLKNRVSLGLLTIAMCTALACMALTYLISLPWLTPNALSPTSVIPEVDETETQKLWNSVFGIYKNSFFIWIAVCAVVLLLQSANLFMSLKGALRNYVPKWWPWRPRSINQNRPVGP